MNCHQYSDRYSSTLSYEQLKLRKFSGNTSQLLVLKTNQHHNPCLNFHVYLLDNYIQHAPPRIPTKHREAVSFSIYLRHIYCISDIH
jgi:hypothetical protein